MCVVPYSWKENVFRPALDMWTYSASPLTVSRFFFVLQPCWPSLTLKPTLLPSAMRSLHMPFHLPGTPVPLPSSSSFQGHLEGYVLKEIFPRLLGWAKLVPCGLSLHWVSFHPNATHSCDYASVCDELTMTPRPSRLQALSAWGSSLLLFKFVSPAPGTCLARNGYSVNTHQANEQAPECRCVQPCCWDSKAVLVPTPCPSGRLLFLIFLQIQRHSP